MNSIDRLAATAVSRRPIRLGIERSTPLKSPLAALLAADDEADTRTFDTVSVESGSFGELVPSTHEEDGITRGDDDEWDGRIRSHVSLRCRRA